MNEPYNPMWIVALAALFLGTCVLGAWYITTHGDGPKMQDYCVKQGAFRYVGEQVGNNVEWYCEFKACRMNAAGVEQCTYVRRLIP